MPINVFGNSSSSHDYKIYTSLCIQKPYLRIFHVEFNFEEDIDMGNHFRIKKTKRSNQHQGLSFKKLRRYFFITI